MTVTVEESRLDGGTLTLATLPFAKQATSVTLTPSPQESGDRIKTLGGGELLPEETTSWSLNIGAIQDFDDPEGFVNYAFDHDGEVVAFSWRPNGTGPTFSGQVKVRAVEIGGETVSRLSTTGQWPVQGTPVRADAGA